jgi:putative flavoprotein involved in K+ transport
MVATCTSCRHLSLQVVLQLRATQEGIPTPVHGLQKVHHPS